MTLSGDDIVEASLLRSREEEWGTSLTSEEKAVFLSKEVKPPKVPSSSLEHPELPKAVEPAEWTTTPKTYPPSAT